MLVESPAAGGFKHLCTSGTLNLPYPFPLLCGVLGSLSVLRPLSLSLCCLYYTAVSRYCQYVILNKYTAVILSILSIAVSSHLCYNSHSGKGTFISPAPSLYRKGCVTVAIKSDAQRKAVAKYNAANYERIELRVEKGQKAVIKAHANKQGEAVNAFVNRAIKETMERDRE